MFFSLSKIADQRFSRQYYVDEFVLNTDCGWKTVTVSNFTVIYKGYLDQVDIDLAVQNLVINPLDLQSGNYCAVIFDRANKKSIITHSSCRSFPLKILKNNIENLTVDGCPIWANTVVSVDHKFNIEYHRVNPLPNIKNFTSQTRQQVINNVLDILRNKTKKFIAHNKLPIKLFLSGGIDTTMIYGLLKEQSAKFDLLLEHHVDYDWFYLNNHSDLKKYATYQNLHHYSDPCVLAHGRPGDEFQLRGNSGIINMILMLHGKNYFDVINQYKTSLHYLFLTRPSNFDQVKKLQQDSAVKVASKLLITANHWILNRCLNDFQGWHLGNTLTWTPFRDFDILKQFLCLEFDDQLDQMFDSGVSKDIIRAIDPTLINLLSSDKNENNYLKNITGVANDFPLEIKL
jgi:hypothetical protein